MTPSRFPTSLLKMALLGAMIMLLVAVPLATAETIYTVQPGDTLASIARRHGTSITALAQANNLVNPNLIFPNQQLRIPDGVSPAPPPPVSPPPSSPTPAPPTTPPGTGTSTVYVVQPGDTLMRIGIRFGVSTAVLIQANNIANPNFIYVGQRLTIPNQHNQPNQPNQPTQPPPTQPPPPPTSNNLLPNPSFEGGWYHPGGNAELQIPEGWRFEWDEGPTGFGSNSWDVYHKPEVRVLNRAFLPPHEHADFIFHGNQTVKVFKGSAPVSFRLLTEVALPPGTYRLTIRLFPDLVMGYEGGQKVWATDSTAGDVRLIMPGGGTGWLFPTFGQRNEFRGTFTLNQAQTVTVGTAVRGRFAIQNNGFFLDDWSLVRVP